jgi:hypothetical protein
MKKIEISLSEKQYEKLTSTIKARAEINFQEETFSGFELVLNVIEGNISWLELNMSSNINLGEVEWKIK